MSNHILYSHKKAPFTAPARFKAFYQLFCIAIIVAALSSQKLWRHPCLDRSMVGLGCRCLVQCIAAVYNRVVGDHSTHVQ